MMKMHTIPILAQKATLDAPSEDNSTVNLFLERAEQYAKLGNPTITQFLLNVASGFGLKTDPALIVRLEGILQDNAVKRSAKRSEPMVNRRFFSRERRKELAKAGKALPDGSFPIENPTDLRNAIRLASQGSDPAKARAHIKERAKALGLTDMIPATWKSQSDSDLPPAWFRRRHEARAAEALADHELINKHGQDFVIERPDYMGTEEWNALAPAEQTLGAEVVRRQIRRNYVHALDMARLEGWTARAITSGGHEFSKRVDGILQRAILVRKSDQTDFYLKPVSRFVSGTTALRLDEGEVRFSGRS